MPGLVLVFHYEVNCWSHGSSQYLAVCVLHERGKCFSRQANRQADDINQAN